MRENKLVVPFQIKSTNDSDSEYFYFEGYASTYGNVDLGADIVERGAFSRTLKDRDPRSVKLLYQHNYADPLGVYEDMRDDENGLFVKGKMPKENSKVKDVMSLMKCGAIDSMSIGYAARDYEYTDNGVRKLKDVDLYEVSLVTFPMNPKAMVTGMKSADDLISAIEQEKGLSSGFKEFLKRHVKQLQETKVKKLLIQDVKDIKNKRDFERCLRESGAFSVKAAVKLASLVGSSDSIATQVKEQFNVIENLIKNLS